MATQQRRLKFAVGIFIILLTLGWLGYTGVQESKTYYVTVAELLASPDVQQRRYRVAGEVASGSIHRNQGRVQFRLRQGNHLLPVVYTGRTPLPDTFQDGAEAIADGRYQADGTFHAETIQAKCASKYEAMQSGTAGNQETPGSY